MLPLSVTPSLDTLFIGGIRAVAVSAGHDLSILHESLLLILLPRSGYTYTMGAPMDHCSICHCYCGASMEAALIDPQFSLTPQNTISVCPDCHAEIRLSEKEIKFGIPYTPDELRGHKRQWAEHHRDYQL